MHDAFTNHYLNLYSAAAEIIGPALCDEPRVIVDAACGLGYGFAFLGSLGRYVGLDCSLETVITSCLRYPNGEFHHGDFSSSRWLAGFNPDVVVSLETADRLCDPESFLRRIALAIPVHGLFIFSVPTCLMRDLDRFRRWDLSADVWGTFLTAAGFTVERSETFEIRGSFREFLATVPTTWRDKLRVALFDLTHPVYLIDRLWNWILHDRFTWQSTFFVCRSARVRMPHTKPHVEVIDGHR